MAVPAVGGRDGVAVVEVAAHAGGRGLLAGVEVDEAGDVAGGELLVHPLLEVADGAHRPVGVEQGVRRQLGGRPLGQGAGHTITIPPSIMTDCPVM